MLVVQRSLRNDCVSCLNISSHLSFLYIFLLNLKDSVLGLPAIRYDLIQYKIRIFSNQQMGYNRFIQIGRVARINYGPLEGSLATIVDIVNTKRVLIDGEGIARQVIPITRLQLTSQVIKVGRGTRSNKLSKIIAKQNVQKKFNESTLGKSLSAQTRRENLNDFQRFKALTLRRKLSKLLRARQTKRVSKKK